MQPTLTDAIANYIEQRKQTKLEPLKKVLNKVLEKSEDEFVIAQARSEYGEKSRPIEEAFDPNIWLTDAAKRAKQISMATHSAKFTHSDAKASSVLLVSSEKVETNYLVTASLDELAIDAVGNAAALDVAKLLKINVNGENLVTQLQKDSASALAPFSSNDDQLKDWVEGFKKALSDEKLSFHNLNKQIYFPIDSAAKEYNLLCPLYSSAIAHQLHERLTSSRFGDSKDVRDARRAERYHDREDIIYPATAVQIMGGSKPQNISQLNSERYGQNFLLNTAPPKYQRQIKPPKSSRSIFNSQLNYRASSLVREFRAFLSELKPDERNFKVRYKRDYKFINPIIELLLDYGATVQAMPSGWASEEDNSLKSEHGLWLDVYNESESFQRDREKLDWLEVIASDFAVWLAKRLENKEKYVLSDVERAYFKKLCLEKLKKFERATPKRGERI